MEPMDVDCNDAARKVWLVKVPKYIHSRWQKAPKTMNAGKLKISKSKTGSGQPDVTFSLSEEMIKMKDENDASVPKEHKFVITNIANQVLAVFSETPSSSRSLKNGKDGKEPSNAIKVEGQVIQRAECKPVGDSNYMRLKKSHIMKASQPQRTVQKLDGIVNNYKPKANHQFIIENEKKKKESGKRSRDDKDKVMELLFSAFEKHQYYNIRDLEQITRQPLPYLKEILKEICNYNLKNPHKNTWELKPEYRHYKDSEEQSKS